MIQVKVCESLAWNRAPEHLVEAEKQRVKGYHTTPGRGREAVHVAYGRGSKGTTPHYCIAEVERVPHHTTIWQRLNGYHPTPLYGRGLTGTTPHHYIADV